MPKNEADIEAWMVAAERADPRTRNPGEARPSKWPDRFVANPEHRRAVRLWIWCKAHRLSFHDVCKRRGLADTTARRHARIAIQRITMLVNLEESLEEHSGMFACACGPCPIDSGETGPDPETRQKQRLFGDRGRATSSEVEARITRLRPGTEECTGHRTR